MLSLKKLFQFLTIILICIVIRDDFVKAARRSSKKVGKLRNAEQNFHEVDAFGDDFIDFGARTGDLGAFSWHADFPLER